MDGCMMVERTGHVREMVSDGQGCRNGGKAWLGRRRTVDEAQ
jgi:hypothetical protein